MKTTLANLRNLAPTRKNVIVPAIVPPLALLVFSMLLCASTLAVTGTEGIYWWPYSMSCWLVVHQVPFYGIGPTGYLTAVGLLPLLPTLGYIALLAWSANTFTSDENPAETRLYATFAVATPLTIAILGWLTLRITSSQVFVQPPIILALIGFVLATTLIGLFGGLQARSLHVIPFSKERFPEWGTEGFRITGRLAGLLILFGSLAAFLSLLVHWKLIGDVLAYGVSAGGILSFGLLTLLYLPNMAVAAAVILAGGGIQVGTTHTSLYSTNISELPALPIFAALPQGEAQWWWLAFLVVPMVATIIATRNVRGEDFQDRVKATLFAAITTASLFAVGAWLTGGSIGVMGRVQMSEALIGIVMAIWLLIVGMATVFSTSGPQSESWESYRKRRAAERRELRKEKKAPDAATDTAEEPADETSVDPVDESPETVTVEEEVADETLPEPAAEEESSTDRESSENGLN